MTKHWKKSLILEIERDLKKRDRQVLKEITEQIRTHRVKVKEARKGAIDKCKADRISLQTKIKERRKAAQTALRELDRAERLAARGTCTDQKQAAVNLAKARVDELLAEYKEKRSTSRILGRGAKKRPALSDLEKRRESDEEVKRNLDPEYWPAWEKNKKRINGTDRKSRTESFLQFLHDHPAELLAAQEALAEQSLEELFRKKRDHEKRMKSPSRKRVIEEAERRENPEKEFTPIPFVNQF